MKICVRVVFAGDDIDGRPNPDGAISLKIAGYSVERYPPEFRYSLAVPGDDFLVAMPDVGGVFADRDYTPGISMVFDKILALVDRRTSWRPSAAGVKSVGSRRQIFFGHSRTCSRRLIDDSTRGEMRYERHV
jgi:hypothetical protein